MANRTAAKAADGRPRERQRRGGDGLAERARGALTAEREAPRAWTSFQSDAADRIVASLLLLASRWRAFLAWSAGVGLPIALAGLALEALTGGEPDRLGVALLELVVTPWLAGSAIVLMGRLFLGRPAEASTPAGAVRLLASRLRALLGISALLGLAPLAVTRSIGWLGSGGDIRLALLEAGLRWLAMLALLTALPLVLLSGLGAGRAIARSASRSARSPASPGLALLVLWALGGLAALALAGPGHLTLLVDVGGAKASPLEALPSVAGVGVLRLVAALLAPLAALPPLALSFIAYSSDPIATERSPGAP